MAGEAALVTGASRGIGKAVALRFAREGYAVAVNYRQDRAGAEEVLKEIRGFGGRALGIAANVADRAEVQRMMESVEKELGPLTVLVNNAGIVLRKSFLDTTDEEWEETFRTNVRAIFITSQEAARRMIPRGRGFIVNISSISGHVAVENRCAYCSSKGAVHMMTKAMALELAPHGIQVNAVAPGIMETEGIRSLMANPEMRASYEKYMPKGRLGWTEECAEAVLFLASEKASYINGAILVVDGGLSSRQALPRL